MLKGIERVLLSCLARLVPNLILLGRYPGENSSDLPHDEQAARLRVRDIVLRGKVTDLLCLQVREAGGDGIVGYVVMYTPGNCIFCRRSRCSPFSTSRLVRSLRFADQLEMAFVVWLHVYADSTCLWPAPSCSTDQRTFGCFQFGG